MRYKLNSGMLWHGKVELELVSLLEILGYESK